MIHQSRFSLTPKPRGYHLVTDEILMQCPNITGSGILNLFCCHTSAGLSLNENCDPSVRVDLESSFNNIVPENQSYYTHTAEGPDDMPAHVKSSLIGVSLTIPITAGRIQLGTWQGIYLCEFRNQARAREIIATVYE